MSEPNIREYNFAIPGNTLRHIPGIPGLWPAGSRVQVNEDTNQVVQVIYSGVIPITVEAQKEPVPETPPALEEEPASN